MIRITVLTGGLRGKLFEFPSDDVRIGRSPQSDLVLEDILVSGEHLRIYLSVDRFVVEDQRSTNGTLLRRGEATYLLTDEAAGRSQTLENEDVLELGSGEDRVTLKVEAFEGENQSQIFALRKIAVEPVDVRTVARDVVSLRTLYEAQQRIGRAVDFNDVIGAIADASLDVVPSATHVTIVLREDEADTGKISAAPNYVAVRTRVRGRPDSDTAPIPITRSVFRKVVSERAVVLAADAPAQLASTDSMLGAKIRSTLGVPLWKGDEILGVLQLDNRESTGMLTEHDADVMAVLAESGSLALANARLVRRLRIAEERLVKENAFLKGKERERRTGTKSSNEAPTIIGDSNAMKKLLAQLDRVVDTKVTVLVEGETGAGKELIASSVHYRSNRRDKLFVSQNCAAMPENLLESELFGHRKGAFTGAVEEKKGLFEIAHGGTLFLDEVTEMPLSLQSKLLRAIQEGEIRQLGAVTEKRVNVRIVAATNRNLEKEVAEGRFREDLYYRLKVFPLRVPPLRERREDIPLLANYFFKRFSEEFGKPIAGVTQQAMELLQGYDWPGNVRELQNEVQRVMIQVDLGGFVAPDLLSPRVRQIESMVEKLRPAKGTLKEMVDQVEKFLLIESLREHSNNKTASAKTLGITREGLHKKLRQFGIS